MGDTKAFEDRNATIRHFEINVWHHMVDKMTKSYACIVLQMTKEDKPCF